MKKKTQRSDIEDFIARPDSEKDKIVKVIEAKTTEELLAESRPLNAAEKAMWKAFKRKAGRPRIGKDGVEKVSISVEKSLLKQADIYARRNKLNRSEMFARGLQRLIRPVSATKSA